MEEGFLKISNVPTKVVTFGQTITSDTKPFNKKTNAVTPPKDVVLIIPGNPGITTFYLRFMRALYDRLHCPIWIISHQGHEIANKHSIPFPFRTNDEKFGLRSQIQHKADFIHEFIPESARIHLFGHSIGAYMCLELLKDDQLKDRIADVGLLFPTFEYMAETDYGKLLSRIRPISNLLVFLTWIFTILPRFLKLFILYIFQWFSSIPLHHQKSLLKFLDPDVLSQVFYLGYQELESVRQRDDDVIAANLKRIHFVYGQNDGWTPQSYRTKLKIDYSNANLQVVNYSHSFVLRESEEMADLITKSIKIQ